MPAYPQYPRDDGPNDADLAQTQAWSPEPAAPAPDETTVGSAYSRFKPDYSFAHDSDTAERRLAARRAADADSLFASGIWAETEPDDTPAAPTPAKPVAARALPPTDDRPAKPRRLGLWIGLGAGLVVILAAALVVWFVVVPLNHAKTDFTAAQPALAQARSALQTAVDTTQTSVGGVQPSDLADATLLDQYTGLLDQAQTTLATPDPVMASSTQDIRRQIDQMTALATTMNGQAANLARLSAAILISRDKATYLKAKANLTAAVAAAQTVYDASEGNVDNEDLRTTLKAKIDEANQLLAAQVADADLATTATQMNTMAVDLATADQAVVENQRATGGRTFTYTLLASDGQINASQMPVDAIILAMKVYVTGSLVQIQTCYKQGGVTDLSTCDGYFTGQYYDMTGSRDGDTAAVQDVDPASLYLWGTVTFSSTAVSAPAILFTGPPGLCQLPDGTVFGDPTLPSCGNVGD